LGKRGYIQIKRMYYSRLGFVFLLRLMANSGSSSSILMTCCDSASVKEGSCVNGGQCETDISKPVTNRVGRVQWRVRNDLLNHYEVTVGLDDGLQQIHHLSLRLYNSMDVHLRTMLEIISDQLVRTTTVTATTTNRALRRGEDLHVRAHDGDKSFAESDLKILFSSGLEVHATQIPRSILSS